MGPFEYFLITSLLEDENRNDKARKGIRNVSRPDDPKPTDARSKLVKTMEIQRKVIDEVKEMPNDEKEYKGFHPDSSPKVVTGGKTEVDIHPKTDDQINDNTRETVESKKARAKENKAIGQPGAPTMKEGRTMKLLTPAGWRANGTIEENDAKLLSKMEDMSDVERNEFLKGINKVQAKRLVGESVLDTMVPSSVAKLSREPRKTWSDPTPPKKKPVVKKVTKEEEDLDEYDTEVISEASKYSTPLTPEEHASLAQHHFTKKMLHVQRPGEHHDEAARAHGEAEMSHAWAFGNHKKYPHPDDNLSETHHCMRKTIHADALSKAAHNIDRMQKEDVELTAEELARLIEIADRMEEASISGDGNPGPGGLFPKNPAAPSPTHPPMPSPTRKKPIEPEGECITHPPLETSARKTPLNPPKLPGM